MQGLFVPFARVGSRESCEGLASVHNNKYAGYIEAFIAETYVQLVATETVCYATAGCVKVES